jgi:hypothetical protein
MLGSSSQLRGSPAADSLLQIISGLRAERNWPRGFGEPLDRPPQHANYFMLSATARWGMITAVCRVLVSLHGNSRQHPPPPSERWICNAIASSE